MAGLFFYTLDAAHSALKKAGTILWSANYLVGMLLDIVFGLDGDYLANTVRAHADAIYAFCYLHCPPIVCDYNELSPGAQLGKDFSETVDIGFVKHCINFIQYAEWGRRYLE